MMRFVTSYFLIEAVVVVAAVMTTLWIRRNRLRRNQQVPSGFVRTDEVFIDPTTNLKQIVWYHPQTGERYYQTSKLPDEQKD